MLEVKSKLLIQVTSWVTGEWKPYVFWTWAVFILSDIFVVLLWLQVCSQYFIHQHSLHGGDFLTHLLWHLKVLSWFDLPFWQYYLLLFSPVLLTSKLKEKSYFLPFNNLSAINQLQGSSLFLTGKVLDFSWHLFHYIVFWKVLWSCKIKYRYAGTGCS